MAHRDKVVQNPEDPGARSLVAQSCLQAQAGNSAAASQDFRVCPMGHTSLCSAAALSTRLLWGLPSHSQLLERALQKAAVPGMTA